MLTLYDAGVADRPWLGGRGYRLADIAYVPWMLSAVSSLLDRLAARPASGQEVVVAAL
ncbi:MAG: hypothetical protein ABI990_02905 [Actinomycetota bacterium]